MKRTKVKSIIFCSLAMLLLFSALGCKVADKAGVLPRVFDNGSMSYLECRDLQGFPAVSLSLFNNGIFQNEAESYVGACFPNRDGALIANAAVQRRVIEASNIPFGNTSVPTFFGSNYCTYDGSIVGTAVKIDSVQADRIQSSLRGIEGFASKNPNTAFFFYLPDMISTSEINPTTDLVSNSIDYEWWKETLATLSSKNIKKYIESHESASEYYSFYFRTDHHWRANGGYCAYQTLCEMLDIPPVAETGRQIYSDKPFFGAYARNGVYLAGADYVDEIEVSLPDYVITRNGEEFNQNKRSEFLSNQIDLHNGLTNSYELLNGGDFDLLKYSRIDADEDAGSKLLVIGDSYASCTDRFFLANFQEVYALNPRYYSATSIDGFIKEEGFDKVVVLLSANTLWNKTASKELLK